MGFLSFHHPHVHSGLHTRVLFLILTGALYIVLGLTHQNAIQRNLFHNFLHVRAHPRSPLTPCSPDTLDLQGWKMNLQSVLPPLVVRSAGTKSWLLVVSNTLFWLLCFCCCCYIEPAVVCFIVCLCLQGAIPA